MPPKKRGLDVIDLISSEGETSSAPPPSKRPAVNRGPSLGQSSGARVAGSQPYNTQRTASSSSFAGPSSQNVYYDRDDADLIDLTQAPDGPARELYGNLDTKIVGVRYYNGYASQGEVVVCLREPTNPYDSNAIRVCNVMGIQIGHIPRKVAEKLAPYVDNDDVALEGTLTGEKGVFDCPVRLHLFGTGDREQRLQLEDRLKKDKLIKATELKKTRAEAEAQRKALGIKNSQSTIGLGGCASAAPEPEVSLEQLTQASQALQTHSRGDAVKSLVIDEDTLAAMPMAEQPAVLEAQLLPYQLQGLAWMTSKESPQFPPKGTTESIQLWQRIPKNDKVMSNMATNFVMNEPKLLSGGILADDMGLGKTLQVISLILTGGPGTTLIVAPLSVMSNWEQQMRRHVKKEHLPSIYTYHGSNKVGKDELAKYQVVITSYNTLAMEGPKKAEDSVPKTSPLMQMKWRRVVLDEGHTIRNAKTKAAIAATKLTAQSRWALTGTPIINNIKDFQSLLQFLHITGGVEQPVIFNTVISRPLAQGHQRAETLLQLLMRDLCLRRKKDMKFVDLKLPPKTEYVHRIQFRPDEKNKYEALLNEAKGALEDYRNQTKAGKGQFQSVLERLLRLRQVCNHWTLCRKRIDDLLKVLEGQSVVSLNPENVKILQEALRLYIETQEDCAVCLDTLDSPVITHCKHVFCRGCITKVIQTQQKCPMCRNQLEEDSLLEPAPEGGEEAADDGFDSDGKSSKTEALVKIVQATTKDPKSKIVIFSQWTSFLNIIQAQIAEAGIKFCRIDGSMTAAKRDAAIDALDNDPNTRVMLASLAVCSVGLNLVSADTVILADSWWAPAIEDQAVDRVHRLGQKRPTTVWRLVMEGTVEERVLDIQHEKRTLVGKAFQEKNKGKKTQETRMADIQKLLG
ncbi:putative SWI/SNF-related matrix-associated actin-dependent regulator of chromatin subfamily A member 3-like 1 [Colletotrichum siamense]|uniref:SNF2 family domain-containing protein n=1 Tax=Colletotrichum siamense TaxID=690259 RepID=UPI0018727D2D|nr:SNF2 family domain-containing protein [Colletotrichum siamense]KAF5506564.1 putative SWI/SNF-related matrix-associated actin-dependent regulator of chromatin subfamily A member 3-like 1 [Colletotrichum siamense]